MKKITLYEAKDGRQFTTEAQCLDYESNGCVEFFPLPGYGDHVPITKGNITWMIDGDGSCYYATKDRMSRKSAHRAPHPEWATHLIYFGK